MVWLGPAPPNLDCSTWNHTKRTGSTDQPKKSENVWVLFVNWVERIPPKYHSIGNTMITTAPLSNRPILHYSAVEQLFFFFNVMLFSVTHALTVVKWERKLYGFGQKQDAHGCPMFFSMLNLLIICFIIIFPNTCFHCFPAILRYLQIDNKKIINHW